VFAAVLTVVPVACEDVSTVELDFGSGEPVVREQADDARHSDIEIHGCDPVVAVRFEASFEVAGLAPALEIIIAVSVVFE